MKRDMRRLGRDKRGVEPVIAALLLIAIAVAAAVVTYSWVMGMISSQGSQAQTSIRIDVVEYHTSQNYTAYVTVRNSGTVGVTIDTTYITNANGTTQTLSYAASASAGTFSPSGSGVSDSIASKASAKYTIYITHSTFRFIAGQPYVIKVVTDNGFAVEGTYYKPSS